MADDMLHYDHITPCGLFCLHSAHCCPRYFLPHRTEEMQAIQLQTSSLNVSSSPSPLFLKRNNGRKCISILAKRNDLPEKSRIDQKPIFPLKVSNNLLSRSLVAVLALGFIDAGYSGDWSRIGVISTEGENLLKIAAFVIVPLCIFLIFNVKNEQES